MILGVIMILVVAYVMVVSNPPMVMHLSIQLHQNTPLN